MVKLYIHGVPVGHAIWGDDAPQGFLNRFYGEDKEISTPQNCYLQVDIYKDDSYYTYVRRGNVFGSKSSDGVNRPGSFFAMTLRFVKSYCTNVSLLHKLFEAIFERECIGTFLVKDSDRLLYKVASFDQAKTGTAATVSVVDNYFQQNLQQKFSPYIQSFKVSPKDTFNSAIYPFSFLEVDSPLFSEMFDRYKLVIANYPTRAELYENVLKEKKALLAEKAQLIAVNNQLQSDLTAQQKQNATLTTQLTSLETEISGRHQKQTEQFKAQVAELRNETDRLKDSLEAYKAEVEKYKNAVAPIKQLNHIFGINEESNDGRTGKKGNSNQEVKAVPSHKTGKFSILRRIINPVLLLLILTSSILSVILLLRQNSHTNVNSPETSVQVSRIDTYPPANTDLSNDNSADVQDKTSENTDI